MGYRMSLKGRGGGGGLHTAREVLVITRATHGAPTLLWPTFSVPGAVLVLVLTLHGVSECMGQG